MCNPQTCPGFARHRLDAELRELRELRAEAPARGFALAEELRAELGAVQGRNPPGTQLMGFLWDLYGICSDLMGFYSDLMGDNLWITYMEMINDYYTFWVNFITTEPPTTETHR